MHVVGSNKESVQMCEFLQRSLGEWVIIPLRLQGNELQRKERPIMAREALHEPLISLRDAVPFLETTMIFDLAYIIAKSVWYYYDTNFINTPWSIESILFIKHRRRRPDGNCEPEIDIHAPFLRLPAPEIPCQSPENTEDLDHVNPYPRLLAFAMTLAAMCRQPINISKHNSNCDSSTRFLNDAASECSSILDDESFERWLSLKKAQDQDIGKLYKDIIKDCCNGKAFSKTTNVNERRRLFY